MPNPRLGYLLVALSAACSALNGSLARYLLDDGMSAVRLSQLRSAVSFVLLLIGLALLSRDRLKIAKADVPKLAWLGIAGIALVHASYFAAIARIDIGVALVIQYTAPALLLLWLRVVHKRHVARSLWAAVALSMLGSAFVVDVFGGGSGLDALGVLAAVCGAVTLVIYLVSSERAGQRYDAFTTLLWGFGFATLFWVVVAPVWTFPFELLSSSSQHRVGARRVGDRHARAVPADGHRAAPPARRPRRGGGDARARARRVIAWGVHDQTLAATQIAGGVVVLAAIAWVQTHRPSRSLEEWTSSSPEATGRSPVAS